MPAIVDKSSITKVCVDDFALRKRFSYGTVMVDLESHRIIDLIPSRETADVANWLATFPNIQVLSREGAATYSSAVTCSHPDAVQVSDRFHLIKGLSEAITKYIIRKFPARIEIPLTEEVPERGKPCITLRTGHCGSAFPIKKERRADRIRYCTIDAFMSYNSPEIPCHTRK